MVKTEEKYTLRKSKKYKNLVSVGLGLATAVAIGMATDNEAFASDVDKTDNPATNSVTKQPESTPEANNSQGKVNQSQGSVEVNLKSPELEKVVEKAVNGGVKVEKSETVDKGTVKSTEELSKVTKEVQEEYKKKAEEISNKTETYLKDKQKNQEEISKVTKENEDKKIAYEKALSEYNKKLEEVKNKNEEIKSENEKKTTDYNNEVDRITKENLDIVKRNQEKKEKYERDLAIYKKMREEQEKEKDTLIKGKPLLFSKDGISVYGTFNEAGKGSLAYYKDILVVNDTEKTNTVTLKNGLDWNPDTKLEKITDSLVLDKDYGLPNTESGKWVKFSNVKTGDKFKITNMGETLDGRKVHAIVTVEVGEPMGTVRNGKPTINQEFSVSYATGGGFYFDYQNMKTFKLKFDFVDDNGNPLKIGYGTVVGDVDWGQGSRVDFDKNVGTVAPHSSNLREKNGVMYSNLDASYKNFESTPEGTFLTVGMGSSLTYTHYSYDKDKESLVRDQLGRDYDNQARKFYNTHKQGDLYAIAFNLFGKSSELKSFVYNQPPKAPVYENEKPLPDKPTLEELKVEPPKPDDPVYKEVPKTLDVVTVKYNYYKVNVLPNIEKQVKNVENQDINNQYVSKLSTVKWELRTKELPAGRKEIDKYVIKDSLPKGYILDVEKTKEESKDYDLSYNKDTHTVTLTATAKLLEQLNKDLTKSILAPIPTLVGTVTNDGATYKNNFSLTINNDYEVYSNIVKVSTPGKPNDEDNPNNNLIKPEKHNYNKDGVLIDGKQVERGSINYYKLLWDLDQYKGIKATKEDIKKGFYYVDDYPEEALELLEKDVKIVDSNNNEVKGITVKSYESLEKSPKEVQEMLKKAGITPKGAYQLFTVDNPEEFFEKYVVKGNSIHITSPMKVKEDYNVNGGKYENKAYQIDFGNGYESEVVVNNVPKKEQPPKPEQPKEKEKPKEKTLPKTSAVKENSQGYNNMLDYILMTLLTFVLGFFGIKRKVK